MRTAPLTRNGAAKGSLGRMPWQSATGIAAQDQVVFCQGEPGAGGRWTGGGPLVWTVVGKPGHPSDTDPMNLVKLVVLGAPGVGKTSIIHQFVWNEFTDDYRPTEVKGTFYPAVLINDRLYEVKIVDVPVIPYFPTDSLYEWSEYRFYGLRSANAYILVFDINAPETFQYVKSLRDQIYESRNMQNVPVFVVGNKHDLQDESKPREVASLVKKHWKCGYVECSAKYNWHVVLLFKELMRTLDYVDYGQKPSSSNVRFEGLQGALVRNKCVIL